MVTVSVIWVLLVLTSTGNQQQWIWLYGKAELGLRRIGLEVLWDNDHAIAFYMRCGFLRQGLIPLERQEVQGETRWGVGCAEKAEKYYLHMDFPDERMRL